MANVEETGWVVAGVLAVVSTLTSAVAFLARMVESKNTEAIGELRQEVATVKGELGKCEEKHDECLRDREHIKVELAKVTAEVTFLKSHIEP